MKTIEMEIALMHELNIRQNLIVPNVSWGMNGMHECDLLVLSPGGYATEVEIKVSKADLLSDFKKKHGHDHYLLSYLYFAVPEKLKETALNVIPSRAGLYIVRDSYMYSSRKYRAVYLVRKAQRVNGAKWDGELRLKLARLGALRILGLKSKVEMLSRKK
jgi:hypothetical protein